jgi:hypothetical protein
MMAELWGRDNGHAKWRRRAGFLAGRPSATAIGSGLYNTLAISIIFSASCNTMDGNLISATLNRTGCGITTEEVDNLGASLLPALMGMNAALSFSWRLHPDSREPRSRALPHMHMPSTVSIRNMQVDIRPDQMLGQTAGVMPFMVANEVIRFESCSLTASGSRLRGVRTVLNGSELYQEKSDRCDDRKGVYVSLPASALVCRQLSATRSKEEMCSIHKHVHKTSVNLRCTWPQRGFSSQQRRRGKTA